ncbi:putative PurR-regulated permease PerM [Stackebrandtia endophytica]|uniref:Putative PurR-regulated permease PerM n=1 Tax=Stackebrandtia endophytica TaxID=1496996 RepID=A0A543AT94_9ACTN|nr:AI-2E family transporter [Stackebrandtia endophytica]TQL75788.1 putative PurR-regulated permease PerM [Stackebrandtia endophytica]
MSTPRDFEDAAGSQMPQADRDGVDDSEERAADVKSDAPEHTEASDSSAGDSPFGRSGRPFTKTPFHYGLFGGLGLITAYLIFLGLETALDLIIVIVVGAFLAIGLNPIVAKLERWGMRRGFAVATVCLGAALVLCGGIVAIVPPIVTESEAFIEAAPDLVTQLSSQQWLVNLDRHLGLLDKASQAVGALDVEAVFNAAGGIASVLGMAVGTVFNGIMILLLTVYFLVSFNRLKAGFYRLLPSSRRDRAQALGDEILAKVGGYTVGALGIGAIAGCTSFVFMLFAGVPYAYALAFVVAILDLIPQVGATLGAVVVTLVGLTVSVWVALACAIFFIIYQQLENWLIYPWVMRKSVKVSDLAAILAILVGAGLMGIVGALLAVPTIAAIQLLIREVYIPRQDAT